MTTPAIAVDSDQLHSLAAQLRLAANYAGDVATSVHHGLSLGDLAIAATFDPVGATTFEAAALAVVTGPLGIGGIEARLRQIGDRLVYAAEDYVRADVGLERAAGEFVADLPGAIAATGAALGSGGGVSGAAQAFVGAEPALINGALASVPLTGDLLGSALPGDGHAVVRAVGTDPHVTWAPRDVSDLMGNLAEVDDHRTQGAGDIDIQTLIGTDPAGRTVRKVVVYLPGTDSFDPRPGAGVNNLTGDVLAVAGDSTAYEQGVFTALHAAGVTPADDVTLVGHSQGGIVAANAARDASLSGEFDISHVVTAGAPIGTALRSVPSSTQVLAVENHDDIVPLLDGAPNPARPNIATVTIDRRPATITGRHDLDQSYVPGTSDLERTGNAGLRSFTTSTGDLFHLDQVQTEQYSITRR